MALINTEAKYFQVPSDAVESERGTISRAFKVGIAFIGGSCLVFLGIMAIFAHSSTLNRTSADSTSLIGLPTRMKTSPMQPQMMSNLRNFPGSGPWKELAIAAIEASNRCDRDVSANAEKVKTVLASMDSGNRAMFASAEQAVIKKAEDLKAGIVPPLGFFDPLAIAVNKPAGKLLFYREAELKHGRVCMLAALGFIVGEQFHPLFGGNIDVPSYIAFQETPLEKFWYIVSIAIAIPEVLFAIPTFKDPVTDNQYRDPDTWTMREDGRVPGDLGFDPLGLKPKDPKAFLEMQNKEILNGRLAMIATAGMVAQELVTHKKLFN